MKQQGFFQVLLVIVILTACGQLTNTIYVPVMSDMAKDLNVTSSNIQAVMALYLISYGFSQFIYGPLSDHYGRKPIILIGLVIFIAGSAMSGIAHTLPLLLTGSFIQGMGTGVGGVMSRTVMRDMYSGANLQRANSFVSMIVVFTPLIAPALGSWISSEMLWNGCFWFLMIFGIATWALVFTHFNETHKPTPEHRMNPIASYRLVLGMGQFNRFTIMLVVTISGIVLFEASAGILMVDVLHLPTGLVSLLFILPLPGYLAGSWLAARMAKKHSLERILLIGILLLGLGSMMMVIGGISHYLSSMAILIPAFVYFAGAGLVFPTATTAALEPLPNNAGVAGAVLGGVQNLGSGLITLAASTMPMHNQLPLGVALTMLTVIVVFMFCLHMAPSAKMPMAH
ncbi:Multidrug resistance protein D [invertebrate metagenome]|uniref:Multidrug resistance protein D n=1 Tax=invertebrate metagenome TaxID=1711999 RepID=A0A2H9T5Z1_9ZZZZ